MDTQLKPTMASEIVVRGRPRSKLIELPELTTADGSPARVQCDRLEETFILRNLGLPGARAGAEKLDRVAQLEAMLKSAPIVHAGTAFAGPDGGEVRPAFHCDEAHAVPGSVPWDSLSFDSKLEVMNTLLELGGFGGAAAHQFPARQ